MFYLRYLYTYLTILINFFNPQGTEVTNNNQQIINNSNQEKKLNNRCNANQKMCSKISNEIKSLFEIDYKIKTTDQRIKDYRESCEKEDKKFTEQGLLHYIALHDEPQQGLHILNPHESSVNLHTCGTILAFIRSMHKYGIRSTTIFNNLTTIKKSFNDSSKNDLAFFNCFNTLARIQKTDNLINPFGTSTCDHLIYQYNNLFSNKQTIIRNLELLFKQNVYPNQQVLKKIDPNNFISDKDFALGQLLYKYNDKFTLPDKKQNNALLEKVSEYNKDKQR